MRAAIRIMAVCLGLWAPAAWAGSAEAVFGVRLYGLPVGQMVLARNENGSSYAAAGEFRTTGLAGLLARVRFSMSSKGAGSQLDMRPRRYTEDLDTGYRTSAVDLSFGAGDRRIDPLTGIVAALLDRDAEAGCAYDGETWDGKRAMRVRIRPVNRAANGDLTCAGRITRLSGYSAEDMAAWKEFPFTVRYERSGDRLVAVRGEVDTIHGKVALQRR